MGKVLGPSTNLNLENISIAANLKYEGVPATPLKLPSSAFGNRVHLMALFNAANAIFF